MNGPRASMFAGTLNPTTAEERCFTSVGNEEVIADGATVTSHGCVPQ